jgi:hypothetical protein
VAKGELLQRIVAFIESLGISVHEREMRRKTLVPGIDIEEGALVFEESGMCKPADLLHEAGHIALTLPAKRPTLDGTIESSPAEEMAAIAWTWAAATLLNIDPREVFHEEVISGNGPTLLEHFLGGKYIGVPMLRYWGLTGKDVQYPRMSRWMRDDGEASS